jgi:hypothetical protein
MSDTFRKKSLDNASAPEHLDDYINVANPSVWIILGAIIAFLLGVGIWCIFGQVDGISPMALLFSNTAA